MRTLDTLSAAAMRRRILADTEEVTGSNPVSPTSNAPGQRCFWAHLALGWLTCRPRTVGLSIDSITGMRPRST